MYPSPTRSARGFHLAERDDYNVLITDSLRSRIQVFDPQQDCSVIERRLPHWSQAGTISFITWRAWDSIPKHVLAGWLAERAAWLKQHSIAADAIDWQKPLAALGPRAVQAF